MDPVSRTDDRTNRRAHHDRLRHRVPVRIQSTLDPYGGRFLVHKAPVAVVEGARPGAVVVIGFPSLGEARTWYASPAYRELVPLRARNMAGDVVLVEGVAPDYDPRGTAAALRAEAAATPAA
ncbi:DUF1330 domain-containing protein [Streptomyces sp. DT225]